MPRPSQKLAPQQFSPLPQLPVWVRQSTPVQTLQTPLQNPTETSFETAHETTPEVTLGEAAFWAGAALAMLDARVRAGATFAGVWRQRLALKAAAASARILRRGEDEATLRDAFYLRYGNDDPGPAGRILVAWRALSCSLDADVILYVASLLDLKIDDGLRAAIDSVQQLALDPAPYCDAPFAAAETARLLFRSRSDHPAEREILALWLADVVLAIRLKWPQPLPLIAGALLHPSLRISADDEDDGLYHRHPRRRLRRPYPGDPNWMHSCTLAYWHAAIHACDLFTELDRKAQKLAVVAPRLRAKGAAAVVEKLHNEDAALPSTRVPGAGTMSRRGLQRLFDRLVALGAVRELTGRATFRLYGL
jgi:hypothetical protein